MHLNKHQIGEFLYSHFNIENEGNTLHFWHIMFYCFKKGKNTIKIQEKICAVYGEGTVTDWTSKVVCKVSCWRFLTGQCSLVG